MHPRRVSISDMAQTLNLAPSTVSRALAQEPHVSAATRQRVQQLAKALQYQPNQVAVALRKGHSNTLGVLVPHLTGSFFPEVVDGIIEVANQAGYNVMVCPSREDAGQEKRNLELLTNAQVAGLLVSLASGSHDVAHFEALQAARLPLVFFDRAAQELTGNHISSVVLDDYAGAYAVVAHLVAEGYRRIAHLGGPPHLGIYQQRYQGYRQALHDHSLPCLTELYHVAEPSQAAGTTAMAQLLQQPMSPDAVFSAHDSFTAGALLLLKAQGLRIPADVALAGFSNAEFTSLTEPPLTTVDQCSRQMGRLAVQQLLQLLHADANAAPLKPILLRPQLLVRASSRRVAVPLVSS
ncbi:MAG: LacI family DNA-binding transcriptional regulator [Janthinobacterium lividum]